MLFVFSFFLFSCAVNPYYTDFRWNIKNLQNEWGDYTNIWYASYTRTAPAFYSNTWDTNSIIYVGDIRFSKSFGLRFSLSKQACFFNDNNCPFFIRLPNGKEYTFKASYTNIGNYGVVSVPFTQQLAEVLCQDNPSIRFSVMNYFYCKFNFPSNFKYAWEHLNSYYQPNI